MSLERCIRTLTLEKNRRRRQKAAKFLQITSISNVIQLAPHPFKKTGWDQRKHPIFPNSDAASPSRGGAEAAKTRKGTTAWFQHPASRRRRREKHCLVVTPRRPSDMLDYKDLVGFHTDSKSAHHHPYPRFPQQTGACLLTKNHLTTHTRRYNRYALPRHLHGSCHPRLFRSRRHLPSTPHGRGRGLLLRL